MNITKFRAFSRTGNYKNNNHIYPKLDPEHLLQVNHRLSRYKEKED